VDLSIRPAGAEDSAACAALYAPYVLESAVTFETDPPDTAEMAGRIEAAHLWLVAVQARRVIGYVNAVPWKTRAAYARTCETGIYLDQSVRGQGVGRTLYAAAVEALRDRGFSTIVTAMAEPNPASTALHESLGFERVGTLRKVGFKRGAWHATTLSQRDLT